MACCNKKFIKEVSIDNALYQSMQGHYFIGQTPFLTATDKKAIVALVNPKNSKVNLYLNAITITNKANSSLSSEVYLRSTFTGGSTTSMVTCVNTDIHPIPDHKGQIEYINSTTKPPSNGIPIFSRIASPQSTLVADGSQIIIAPGQSLVIYLGGFLDVAPNSVKVALGWWEEQIPFSY